MATVVSAPFVVIVVGDGGVAVVATVVSAPFVVIVVGDGGVAVVAAVVSASFLMILVDSYIRQPGLRATADPVLPVSSRHSTCPLATL